MTNLTTPVRLKLNVSHHRPLQAVTYAGTCSSSIKHAARPASLMSKPKLPSFNYCILVHESSYDHSYPADINEIRSYI